MEKETEELEEKEIYQTIRRMKKGKAAGIDEIPMKAWIYGGTALRKKISRDYKASLEDRSNTEGLGNKRNSSDI